MDVLKVKEKRASYILSFVCSLSIVLVWKTKTVKVTGGLKQNYSKQSQRFKKSNTVDELIDILMRYC